MEEFVLIKDPADVIGYFVENLNGIWCPGIVCKDCAAEFGLKPGRTVTLSEHGGGLSCEICEQELG